MVREFDVSTLKGLRKAEWYKACLESKFNKVIVTPIGLDHVRIEGRDK